MLFVNEDRNRTYVFSTFFYTALAKSFNTSDYPSHFTASQIRHEKVKKWTKNVNIFDKDFTFIPINENNHWFMAVICFSYLSGKVSMEDEKPVNVPDDNTGRYKLQPIKSTTANRTEADPNVEDLWLFDLASTQNYADKQGVDYDTDVAVLKKNRNVLVKRPCILLFDSLSGGVGRARITATLREWLQQEYIAKYNDLIKDFSPETIKGSLVKMPQQTNYTDCGLFAIHCFKMFFDKPIVDYSLPIRHLENWFSAAEVTKNCQKRRELQSIILTRMKEQKSVLPEGVVLPILNFADPSVTIQQNSHRKNYPENYQQELVVEPYANLHFQKGYTKITRSEQQENDIESPIHNFDNGSFNAYHHVHFNNRNVEIDVNDIHSGLGNHKNVIKIKNISNENFHSFK
ncbi:sentrin-specific protease 6-like [Melanaphis sacchari]|uniref:sentrin-specific protease 6-like n=1 Tax=Melanaphis sacchari TaxID=742174 RepID=UPI000DC12E21|nr:sentrin-specific protease 6-like [Melanaphis sacchari]